MNRPLAGDARSRSETIAPSIPPVASASSCGDGHSANAGLKNQVMTGGDIVAPPGGPTVWRRRRHWTLFIHHQPIRSQPTDAAMTLNIENVLPAFAGSTP